MDGKEVDVSGARSKRSKSVPATMSPAILNDTQLQDQPIVGRSRSNTVDSVERLVRTQRRGARLSSGGLLRNQSKKRRNKDALVKSRSIDVIDRDETNNSSRKSSNSSESSDLSEEDQTIVRARKPGVCLPAVNGVVEKLKTMEDEQEFPSIIDSDQTHSSVVCSTNNEEDFVGDDEQLNSTVLLHENSKLSEEAKLYEDSDPSDSTVNGENQGKTVREQTFDFQNSKINIRTKSLPADLSEYQMDSNLGDCEGHEYRTRLMSTNQTDMKLQNNYGIVYKKRCKNKPWRRWHSLPESLYKVNESTTERKIDQVEDAGSLDERETAVSVEPVDQGLSNMQESSQQQENGNFTFESSDENVHVQDGDTMATKAILEQQHSSTSEEKLVTKEQVEVTKRSSKIKRSFSLPVKFDIVDEDEKQEKENGELKRAKSLSTGDEFDEVFPVMLSEQAAGFNPEPDNEDIDGQDNGDEVKTAVVPQKKSRRNRRRDRRRAKSLPVTLALEEIPEESAEQYSCNEYESVQDMAKKHVNKAFQELLRRIQKSQQPRNKVKRTRSLSTIKEATASSETLHEVESRQSEDVTLEKAGENHEEESTDHENEHAELSYHEHEPERDDQQELHDIDEYEDAVGEIDDNKGCSQQVTEESHYQSLEENNDEVVALQQPNEQDSICIKGQEKQPEEEIRNLREENEKPQLSGNAEDETLALQQRLLQENNEAEEVPDSNKENDEQLDGTTQESAVINESLNERVKEEIPSMHKAKEELHIDIPQIYVSEVECEQSKLSAVDTYGGDVDDDVDVDIDDDDVVDDDDDVDDDDVNDDVDGCEELEGSGEQHISQQREELKSPDDEDIQGTLLEHINNIDFAFDYNINQRSIANVSCMERIPEDPDKETAMEESEETELEPTKPECESEGFGFDSTDAMEAQSTLKRAGSMRKIKRGKMSGASRKKSWPMTNNGESNGNQKRVTWSDFPPDTTEVEDDRVDQEDGFKDQFEPGPRGEFTFNGSGHTSEDVSQDEFEEGPRGEICFTGTSDEHGAPVDQSDQYESDEFELESKFDTLVRNAVNSYLEPDYSQSESPIHRAVAMGSIDHLKELIDEGADVNALDEHGWPPLHVATLFYKVDCAELLLEAGAALQDYTDSLLHEYHTLKESVY